MKVQKLGIILELTSEESEDLVEGIEQYFRLIKGKKCRPNKTLKEIYNILSSKVDEDNDEDYEDYEE